MGKFITYFSLYITEFCKVYNRIIINKGNINYTILTQHNSLILITLRFFFLVQLYEILHNQKLELLMAGRAQ